MMELVFFRGAFQRGDRGLSAGDDLCHFVEVSSADEALVFDRAVSSLALLRKLALLQFAVRSHAAIAIAKREFVGRKVQRVEAGERDELKLVSHRAEFLLEPGDGFVIELLLPVEGW